MSRVPITLCPDERCLMPNAPGSAACRGCGAQFAGTLSERILAHLHGHRGQQFTARRIAEVVGASSQSVAMACRRLRAEGKVDMRPDNLRLYSAR